MESITAVHLLRDDFYFDGLEFSDESKERVLQSSVSEELAEVMVGSSPPRSATPRLCF